MIAHFMKSAIIITLFILYISSNSAHSQKIFYGLPFINNYEPGDYNGGIQNWQITQDKRGLIYVANNFGVLEFDGTNWRQYPVNRGTKIRSICVNNQGEIFVGSQGDFGVFSPNSKGELIFKSLIEEVPQQYRNIDEVWKVFMDGDVVYFCTFSNIYIYNRSNIKVIQTNRYLEPSFFVGGQLYIQSPGSPLMILDKNNNVRPIEGGHFFTDKLLTSILPYSKDQLFITTKDSGVFLFDGYDLKKWDLLEPGSTINCAIRLSDGKIVLGTQSSGIYVFDVDGTIHLHINKSNGLASNTVLSLFQDKANNLWVGLNNGISHIELASPLTLLKDNLGIEGTGYTAHATNEHLFLGTNIGLYKSTIDHEDIYEHGILKYSMLENSEGQVYNIQKISNDIFIGHHNGAYTMKDFSPERISTTGAWTFIRNPTDPRKVILGTYSGISNLVLDEDGWSDQGRMYGFYESSRVMELDNENNLWMTHGYKGAYKIKIDYMKDSITEVKFYNHRHGFPSDILINVFNIKNELLFSAERGIYKYDKDKDHFYLHPLYTELLGENIHIRDMDDDPLGNIYFITNDQCGVIKKSVSGDLTVDLNTFNKIPKLLNDDLINVNAIDMNNIIFSAKEGFIHYQPNKNENVIQDSPILIRRVECITENDSILFDGNYLSENDVVDNQPNSFFIQLPYKKNDLRFTFASPFYEGASEITYKYQLKGFDRTWSEWNSKTEKDYTNLSEGDYEFLVISKNIFGIESDIASFRFSIDAPWYRSIIAYSMYTLFGIFSITIGMYLVDRKHKRDKAEIRQKQKVELSNKEKELESVQQQKAAEIEKLKNEKLNAELNHKNSELASATMHLLTKNTLLAEIKSKLFNIKDQAVKTETKKGIDKILKEIESSIDLDKDWEQFEFHFDRVHRDFNKRMKEQFPQLTPQEMKLSAYLRLNFSTKEIAQLLHISVRGVEISRYRLRKKLDLSRDTNLAEFILNF